MLKSFRLGVAGPQFCGGRELAHGEGALFPSEKIVFNESFPVRTICEWDIKRFGITHTLLQTGINGVLSVLRLNNCNRNAGGIHQEVIGLLLIFTSNHTSAYNDFATGKKVLGEDLGIAVP